MTDHDEADADASHNPNDSIEYPSSSLNQHPTTAAVAVPLTNGQQQRSQNDTTAGDDASFSDADVCGSGSQYHTPPPMPPLRRPQPAGSVNNIGNHLHQHQHEHSSSTPIGTAAPSALAYIDTNSPDNISMSSSEGTFFDLDGTNDGTTGDQLLASSSLSIDYFDCDDVDATSDTQMFSCIAETTSSSLSGCTLIDTSSSTSSALHLPSNGLGAQTSCCGDSSDSGSESLPVSQMSTSSRSSTTVTGNDNDDDDDDTISSSSAMRDAMKQKQTLLELCLLSQRSQDESDDGDRAIASSATPSSSVTAVVVSNEVEMSKTDNSTSSSTTTTPSSMPHSDEDCTPPSSSSLCIDNDELLAADPVLEIALEHRDNEEACDAADSEHIVVNADGIDESSSTVLISNGSGSGDDNNDDELTAANGGGSSNSSVDDADVRPQRLRRCSSLKTGKTPPGTPGRKKFVRFADVLGLDLADVKTFMDEIPTVPRCAYDYLTLSASDDAVELAAQGAANQVPLYTPNFLMDKMLTPMFQQPGGQPEFLERVRAQNVCLENALITDPICLTISGTVRVRNLDFHKSVHLRYTLDEWASYADFQATYVEQSCDGFSDKFAFTIFGNSLRIGQRLEMAVRFSCKGEQFWDSNFGVNYCFQCMAVGGGGGGGGAGVAASSSPATNTQSFAPLSMVPVTSASSSTTVDDDALFY